MKKTALLILVLTLCVNCMAQKPRIKNLSKNIDMNYVFARIYPKKIITKELYERGLFTTIFQISDSKATPKNITDGHEFLDSYLVSIFTDGDDYTGSKLYKIEGLYNSKIIEIKEIKYPKFLIKIEYGILNNRKIEDFILEGSN